MRANAITCYWEPKIFLGVPLKGDAQVLDLIVLTIPLGGAWGVHR